MYPEQNWHHLVEQLPLMYKSCSQCKGFMQRMIDFSVDREGLPKPEGEGQGKDILALQLQEMRDSFIIAIKAF